MGQNIRPGTFHVRDSQDDSSSVAWQMSVRFGTRDASNSSAGLNGSRAIPLRDRRFHGAHKIYLLRKGTNGEHKLAFRVFSLYTFLA